MPAQMSQFNSSTFQVSAADSFCSSHITGFAQLPDIRRIDLVRKQWSNFQDDGRRTFAWYWARGEVEQNFPSELFQTEEFKDELWKGIVAPGRTIDQPIESMTDLTVPLVKKIEALIADTLIHTQVFTYCSLALTGTRNNSFT